jgi:hypothetical protein
MRTVVSGKTPYVRFDRNGKAISRTVEFPGFCG